MSIFDLADVARNFNKSVPPPERDKQFAGQSISILDLADIGIVFTNSRSSCPKPCTSPTAVTSAPSVVRTDARYCDHRSQHDTGALRIAPTRDCIVS